MPGIQMISLINKSASQLRITLYCTFHSYREKQNLKEQTQSESLALQDIKQDGGEYEENKSTHLHPLSENPVQIKE